jgi:hypothetical protein
MKHIQSNKKDSSKGPKPNQKAKPSINQDKAKANNVIKIGHQE